MLTHVKLRLCLVIFQIVVFQFGIFPLRGKDLIVKIRVIYGFIGVNIFHQITHRFSDIFKRIDVCRIQIIGVQDLVDEFGLCHDLGNICHCGNSNHLIFEIPPCTRIAFTRQKSELDSIQERIETNRFRLVLFGHQKRRKLFAHNQRIFIG